MQLLAEFPDRTGRPSDDGAGMVGYGGCTRCGCNRLDRHVGVVDIDVHFYGEGAVILCADCAAEIGGLVGMLTATQVNELLASADEATVKLIAAEALIEQWRPFVEAARDVLMDAPLPA